MVENVIVGVDLLPARYVQGAARQVPAALLDLLVLFDADAPLPCLGIHLHALLVGHCHEDHCGDQRQHHKEERHPALAGTSRTGGVFSSLVQFCLQLSLLFLLILLALKVIGFTLFSRGAACRAELVFIRIERIAVRTQPVRIFVDVFRVLYVFLGFAHIESDVSPAGLAASRADLFSTGDMVRAAVVAVPASDQYFSHWSPRYDKVQTVFVFRAAGASRRVSTLHFSINCGLHQLQAASNNGDSHCIQLPLLNFLADFPKVMDNSAILCYHTLVNQFVSGTKCP